MTGQNQTPLLIRAFEALISSHLLSQWQRKNGRRLAFGPVICVRYEDTWAGRHRSWDNFFAWQASPEEVVAAAGASNPAEGHLLQVAADRPGLSASYMAMGCGALNPAHFLMARPLDETAPVSTNVEVRRATSSGDLSLIHAINGAGGVAVEDLLGDRLQFYYALIGDRPVALARTGHISPAVSWVSHLHTDPAFRRQGVASELMNHLLNDGVKAGYHYSILLATEMAHELYQGLGYLDLAPILSFHLPPTDGA